MLTQLEAPLRRGLTIDGAAYVLTITPTGFQLTPKGRRKGFEMDWLAFVSGDAALATALNASVAQSRTPGRAKAASIKRSDAPAERSDRHQNDDGAAPRSRKTRQR